MNGPDKTAWTDRTEFFGDTIGVDYLAEIMIAGIAKGTHAIFSIGDGPQVVVSIPAHASDIAERVRDGCWPAAGAVGSAGGLPGRSATCLPGHDVGVVGLVIAILCDIAEGSRLCGAQSQAVIVHGVALAIAAGVGGPDNMTVAVNWRAVKKIQAASAVVMDGGENFAGRGSVVDSGDARSVCVASRQARNGVGPGAVSACGQKLINQITNKINRRLLDLSEGRRSE